MEAHHRVAAQATRTGDCLMPYIPPEGREPLDPTDGYNGVASAVVPGELNFQISRLVNRYVWENDLSYQTISDVVSALECAKLEFYARVARPYEDGKITENGDVYDYSTR